MVVKGKEANNRFARFLTPYIQTQGSYKGCLRFHYFIDGLTPASLAVIKQGAVTKYIFATAYKTRDHWKYAEIDVDFLDDEVLFQATFRLRTELERLELERRRINVCILKTEELANTRSASSKLDQKTGRQLTKQTSFLCVSKAFAKLHI
ncbi:uncharacterized protein LOC118201790 [Stegodyphus dumicola]|uniref:uncharacterized protein LOC118201790 n=1 Tax=Stegodyphus dumicola TaxID=202533 RepID=UPI0015AC5B85|nr:uncharacterized protein LOC118201790 [Stegodyphus dumicola]